VSHFIGKTTILEFRLLFRILLIAMTSETTSAHASLSNTIISTSIIYTIWFHQFLIGTNDSVSKSLDLQMSKVVSLMTRMPLLRTGRDEWRAISNKNFILYCHIQKRRAFIGYLLRFITSSARSTLSTLNSDSLIFCSEKWNVFVLDESFLFFPLFVIQNIQSNNSHDLLVMI